MKTAIIYDKWLSGLGGGEVVACTMATSLRDAGYQVTLLSGEEVSLEEIRSKLTIDLSNITLSTNLEFLTSIRQSQVASRPQTPDLFINLSFMDYSFGIGKKNIYYVHFPSPIRSGLFNNVLLILGKIKNYAPSIYQLLTGNYQERINDRLRAGIYPDMRKRLDSYDTFVTHSKYVAKWTKKYWGKDSHVLYPPVKLLNANLQSPVAKYNWICSIGRFFTLGHGKKQEIMINAFKQLYNQYLVADRHSPIATLSATDLQLHLIGGVGKEPSSLRFVNELQEMAKGYPIHFHFNASRNEVEDILRKSKIYWHAAGFGEDGEKNPVKFEHFGIAPVEAISAGCIPVLYNGGGLPEIIEILELDQNSLFKTIPELIEKTKVLLDINSPEIYNPTPKKTHAHFSSKQFNTSFLDIVFS